MLNNFDPRHFNTYPMIPCAPCQFCRRPSAYRTIIVFDNNVYIIRNIYSRIDLSISTGLSTPAAFQMRRHMCRRRKYQSSIFNQLERMSQNHYTACRSNKRTSATTMERAYSGMDSSCSSMDIRSSRGSSSRSSCTASQLPQQPSSTRTLDDYHV